MKVRSLSPEARDIADSFFFETVVRLHRAGEGEPYTGLKSGGEIEPIIAAADAAIVSADGSALVSHLEGAIDKEVRARLARAVRARAHKDESAVAGREFVEAYVSYLHYVESVDLAAAGAHAAHEAGPDGEGE